MLVTQDDADHALQADLVGQSKMAEAGRIKPPRQGHQGSAIQGRHQTNQTRRLKSPSLTFGHSSARNIANSGLVWDSYAEDPSIKTCSILPINIRQ